MACIKQVQYWPESIVEHPHLREATELDLSWAKLVALPERIGDLPLKELHLDGCNKLTLPESFIQLQLSDDNFMQCCKQVARLPESIVEHHLFKDATSLDLSYAKLVALPERISQLTNLDEPSQQGIVKSLQALNLSNCTNLKALPAGDVLEPLILD